MDRKIKTQHEGKKFLKNTTYCVIVMSNPSYSSIIEEGFS
jgi:hypothetical protein